MYNNKPNKVPRHRKLKHKHQRSSNVFQSTTFHLDQQQDIATSIAKRELQQFSTSFHWEAGAHRINTINNKMLDDWQQAHFPKQAYHTIIPVEQKRYSKERAKTLTSNHQFVVAFNRTQKIDKNRRLMRTQYSNNQQKTKSGLKNKRLQLNLSFKNITSLVYPLQVAKQKECVKKRPFTGKKQVCAKVVNIQPYGQNGINVNKNIKRHLRSHSAFPMQNSKDSETNFSYLINGLSIEKIKHQQKGKQKQTIKKELNDGKSNLLSASKYQSSKPIPFLFMKNDKLVKRKSQKGKWESIGTLNNKVKRVYKIQHYSSLNKDFQKITKLLKQQIDNTHKHNFCFYQSTYNSLASKQ